MRESLGAGEAHKTSVPEAADDRLTGQHHTGREKVDAFSPKSGRGKVPTLHSHSIFCLNS